MSLSGIQPHLRMPSAMLASAIVSAALLIALPLEVSGVGVVVMLIAILTLLNPLSLFVLGVFLAPMRALILTEASGAFSEVGQLLILAFILVLGARLISVNRRLPQIPISIVQVPVVGFTIAVALSAFTAASLTAWLTEFIKWMQVLILISLTMLISQRYRWRWLVYVMIMAAAANATVGIYQFFGGSGALHLVVNGRFFRAFGTFGQPNPFGGFMGMIAPLAVMMTLGHLTTLWQQWQLHGKLNRPALVASVSTGTLAGIIVLALFMSWSRGAWLAFIASFGVMTLAYPHRLWHSVGLLFTGVSLMIFAWYANLIPIPIATRLQSVVLDVSALDDARGVEITTANYANIERLAHWQAAIRMAQDNFWMGVGAGNYEIAYISYQLINWDEALGHAHNYYLNVFSETGAIGLLAYISLWIMIYVLTWQLRRHPDIYTHHVAVAMLGSWTYLAVHSLTDNLYVNNLFVFIGLTLGLLATLHRQLTRFNHVEF